MTDRRRFLMNSSLGIMGAYFMGMHFSSCSKKMNYKIFGDLPETSPFQMKHLRGTVGYFTEKGGTIGWMVDGKNSVIVDTQFPEQAANLQTQMNKITDDKIDIIFNTHHHGDHTSGNSFFKGKVKNVVAHFNSLKNQKTNAIQKNNLNEVLLPDITFENTYVTKVGSENIKCYYYGAAHTDGDSIVHFQESNVVHLGDLIFNRRFPYIDMGSGASIKNWISVHDHILNQFDKETIFIGGHAGQGHSVIVTKEDIKAFQNYLAKLLELGEKSVKSGKTKEQVLAEYKVVPGAEEWKGDGMSRSIDAVYFEITGQ
jgi:cyclase